MQTNLRIAPILLLTIVANMHWTAPASAEEIVRFRLVHKNKPGTPVFLTIPIVTQENDQKLLGSPAADRNYKTRRDEQFAEEQRRYAGTGFIAAPDGESFNGYNIGSNLITHRQICGGLALARLIGGPYKVPSEQAGKVVETFGSRISDKDALPGDIVVWTNGPGTLEKTAKHFALVWKKDPNGRLLIVSKDGHERVMTGRLDKFPLKDDYVRRTIYRFEWDKITATKLNEYEKGKRLGGATLAAKKRDATDVGVVLEAGKPYIIVGEGSCSLWPGRNDGCDSVYRYFSPLETNGGAIVVWGQLKLIDPTIHLSEAITNQTGKAPEYNKSHVYEAVVMGEGKSLKALVYDGGSYGDNGGQLKVSVYEAVPKTKE